MQFQTMFKFGFIPEEKDDSHRGGGVASGSEHMSERVTSLRPSLEIPVQSGRDDVRYMV